MFWKRAAIAVALGLVQALCFPPIGWTLLLPFCLAGFFLLLDGLSYKDAFRLGFMYGLAWYLGDLFWLANIFGPAAISLCAILALFTAIFGALYAWLRSKITKAPTWLLAAVLWTGIEYFRSELFILKFGWLGLGYGVITAPLMAMGAACLGCYGLTFAIMALACLLANCATEAHGDKWNRFRAGKFASLTVMWLLLLLIPVQRPRPLRPLRVHLVQANSEDDESLFSLSILARSSRPDVIVWPEYGFASDPRQNPNFWTKLEDVPRKTGAYFLFGAKDQFNPTDEAGYRNTAFLLDPDGHLIGTHVKNHTVHFFRDGVPGTAARAIPTRLGRLGVAICFDMDYPDVARRLTEEGAEVFLVPNDDPPDWGTMQRIQHRMMFQMRAAECGRWLARADVAGGTSAAAPNGRETVRIGTTGPGTLDMVVARSTKRTLFVRGGWRFGPLCLVALVVLVAAAAFRPFRKSAAPRAPRAE